MGPLVVSVAGRPIPQPRARAQAFAGRARVYDPGTAKPWRDAVRLAAITQAADAGWDPPTTAVSLGVSFFMPRPKRLMRKKDPIGTFPHVGREDLDNLLKSTMDALTSAGVWADDRLVQQVTAGKWYVSKAGYPGALITVSRIG